MSWTYRCPHCRVLLDPHEAIILRAAHAGTRILAGFHPEPGNYEIYFPPDVDLRDGQRWDFFCPVCQADLVSQENENLCALEFQRGEETSRILFSRIAGEKATYVLAEGTVKERHGEHAQSYFEFLMSYRLF